jgi:hypothetical protein
MLWQHWVMAVLINPSEPTTRSTPQQKATGMAALYFLSFLAGD